MEGGEMKDARAGKWLEGLKKYRLAALAALLGIVLMLLPGGNAEAEPTAGSPDAEAFDRGAVQEEMENILRAIDGVGELRLMLTVDSGTKRELAQDTTAERSGSEDMKRKSETVVLLSKGEIDSKKVRVEFSLEDMDMSGFQKGATYEQIKAYVLEHTGLKVSSLYISQIKRKCGLDVGQNYNLSKKEDAKVPKCPPEKEAAIRDALKYFQMI
jgi:23S rRNA (uracil-5-)-methyltransferase rumA